MPAPVSILFGAVFTAAVSFALGKLMLQLCPPALEAGEERVFAFVIGAATLSLLVFLLCAAGLARAGVFLLLGGAALAAACYRRAWRTRGKPGAGRPPLWQRLDRADT